jgi:hypothetical protein
MSTGRLWFDALRSSGESYSDVILKLAKGWSGNQAARHLGGVWRAD